MNIKTAWDKEDCRTPLKKREDRGGGWPKCDLLSVINLAKRPAGSGINLTQEICDSSLRAGFKQSQILPEEPRRGMLHTWQQQSRSVDQMSDFEEGGNGRQRKVWLEMEELFLCIVNS